MVQPTHFSYALRGKKAPSIRDPSSGGIGMRLNSAQHQIDLEHQDRRAETTHPLGVGLYQVEDKNEDDREDEVGDRTGRPHDAHPSLPILEVVGGNGHRLGPAKDEVREEDT